MGSKFGSIHIRAEEIVEEISMLKTTLEEIQISKCSPGWINIYGESLQWGSTFLEAKKLSREIHFPVLSVEYFDDDVLEIHLMQAGKKITSLIQGTALEEYGLRRRRLQAEKLKEVLSIRMNANELDWVCKELDLWDLCEYLKFNSTFLSDQRR